MLFKESHKADVLFLFFTGITMYLKKKKKKEDIFSYPGSILSSVLLRPIFTL